MNRFKAMLLGLIVLSAYMIGIGQVMAATTIDGTNVKIMVVSPQRLEVYKSYIGHLKPVERVSIRSETSGTVEKITFEEGKRISKGNVLVHVSTKELEFRKDMAQSAYDQALSDYQTQKRLFLKADNGSDGENEEYITTSQLKLQVYQARVQYNHAVFEYQAQKKLYDRNMISEDVFQTYEKNLKLNKIQLSMAELNLQQAKINDMTRLENYQNAIRIRKAELDLADLNLDKSKVKAPFSGVVTDKIVQMGSYIQPGSNLLEIMDITQVKVQINIPEQEIGYAKVGKKVTVWLDAHPGRKFNGALKTIGLEADLKTRTFPAEVIIDNPRKELLPGMMAKTEMLAISRDKQIIVPRHAVLEREFGSVVFVEKDGVAIKKRVKTGYMVKEDVQIVSGLQFGDKLIVIGQDLLTNNEAVNVINPQDKIVRK